MWNMKLKGFHHLTLTVTDLNRSRKFYTEVLGLNIIAEISPTRVIVGNDYTFFGLTEPTDPARAVENDRFNENRVGLDHLSFGVDSRDDIERAAAWFDEHNVQHAEIKEIPSYNMVVMMFSDPDNIQLELTAPLA